MPELTKEELNALGQVIYFCVATRLVTVMLDEEEFDHFKSACAKLEKLESSHYETIDGESTEVLQ